MGGCLITCRSSAGLYTAWHPHFQGACSEPRPPSYQPVMVREATPAYADSGVAPLFSATATRCREGPQHLSCLSLPELCALKQLLLCLHLTADGLDLALFSLLSFFMPPLPPHHPLPKNSKLLFTSALISTLVIFVVVLCSVLFYEVFILWLSFLAIFSHNKKEREINVGLTHPFVWVFP